MTALASDAITDLDRLLPFLDSLPLPLIVGQSTGPRADGIRPWRTLFVNQRFRQVLGYAVDEIADGQRWNERVYPDPDYRRERLAEVARQSTTAGIGGADEFVASVVRLRCKDGLDRWFEISKNYGSIHSGGYFVTTFTDVTALRNAQTEIERLARTDDLTGLPNRRALQDAMALAQSRRLRSGNPVVCAMADIDRFKSINDTHGHDCGDEVLVQVARALAGAGRSTDLIGRWGGEEFCLLLCDSALDAAIVLIDRARRNLTVRPPQWQGQTMPVTLTFGVAVCRSGETMDSALSRADAAMLAGKRAGRDRVMTAE